MSVSTLTKEEALKGFQACLDLQEKLNRQIAGSDWRKKNFPWRRAVWLECAELMESLPWKWWVKKNEEPDWDNILIELMDIFHFVLCEVLDEGILEAEDLLILWEEAVEYVEGHLNEAFPSEKVMLGRIMSVVEWLVAEAVYFSRPASKLFRNFAILALALGYSLEDIFAVYIGKNALNEFRQEKGIKEGRYSRSWNGKEDNKVLMEVIKDVPFTCNPDLYKEVIKAKLEQEYQKEGV